jgi:two-component system, response regulator YesN
MKNIFLKYLGTYILILLLPIILGWSIHETVLRLFESYITTTHIALLRQTSEIIDRYTKEIEWRVLQIAGNSKLKSLMYKETQQVEDNILLIREIINELDSYVIYTSNFNTTMYIYIKNMDLVITPNASYSLEDFLQDELFFRVEGMDAFAWHKNIINTYYPGRFLDARKMTLEDLGRFEMDSMVPYIQSLPVGFRKPPEDITGVILFFTSEKEYISLLENINIPAGGWAYIADEHDRILTGISGGSGIFPVEYEKSEKEGFKKIAIDGNEMIVIYTTSAINNWKYTAVLPERFLLDKTRIIKIISFAVMLVCAAIGILLSSVFAYKRAEPIRKIIGLLRNAFEPGVVQDLSKMDELSGSISRLINKNQDMQALLREQKQFVQSAFFNNLLGGNFRNTREMDSFQFFAGIFIPGRKFIVLLFMISGYEQLASMEIIEELHEIKIVVRNILKQIFTERAHFHDVDERRIALITGLDAHDDAGNKRYIDSSIERFYTDLAVYYKAKPRTGIGSMCSSLLEVNNSFEQAKEALNYLLKTEKGHMLWFEQIHRDVVEYYFPLELEMRLLNATRAGNTDQVALMLEIIHKENLVNRSLEPEKLSELFHEMQGTLIKIKSQVALDTINVNANLDKQADWVFDRLMEKYLSICRQIHQKKKSHNSRLIMQIVDYLGKEYSDKNLSLYSVSSQFSISESYLSYFFKEQTGTNFSLYLEKIRIDMAVGLLSSEDIPIKNIAGRVGYNSDKTFRRVFKKVKGVSPSSFRRELKK